MQVSQIQERQDICITEAAQLYKQAEKLSAPSTFAQSAKLSRKAVALEKEVAALEQKKVRLPLLHGMRHAGACLHRDSRFAPSFNLHVRTSQQLSHEPSVPVQRTTVRWLPIDRLVTALSLACRRQCCHRSGQRSQGSQDCSQPRAPVLAVGPASALRGKQGHLATGPAAHQPACCCAWRGCGHVSSCDACSHALGQLCRGCHACALMAEAERSTDAYRNAAEELGPVAADLMVAANQVVLLCIWWPGHICSSLGKHLESVELAKSLHFPV